MSFNQFIRYDWTQRAWALGQHRAYVSVLVEKISSAFADIEAEAEKEAEEEFERGMNDAYDGSMDEGDIAERAMDAGIDKFSDLQFVKEQIHGLVVAGMYHLWERTVKGLICKERWISNTSKGDIQRATFRSLIDLLTEYGFDVRSKDFFDDLETMYLITNACKHGEGKAFQDLLKKAPELCRGPYSEIPGFRPPPSPEDIWIEMKKIGEFGSCIEKFWMEMPDNLRKSDE